MKLKDVTLQEIKGIWGDELQDGEKGTPVIKTNNLTYEGHVDLSHITFRNIPASKVTNCLLRYGDLLIEKSGGTKTHSVGYVNIFEDKNDEYVANNFIFVLRPNSKLIDSKYLFYQLKYRYESGQIEHLHNQTTGIQNLKVQSYLDQEIKYVSIQTQQKISNKLDKIEKAIKLEKSVLNSLDALIKSRFIELFPEDGDFEHDTLSGVTTKITDGSHNPPKGVTFSEYIMASSQNVNDVLNLNDVRYLSKEDFDRENKRTDIQEGDVLFTIVGTIGRTYVIKSEKIVFQRSVAVIKPKKNIINSIYLKYFLSSDFATKQIDIVAHGVAQKGIYLSNLKELDIVVPKIEVQDKFASFVESVDKLKFNVQQRIEKYKELLNKKMSEYFN